MKLNGRFLIVFLLCLTCGLAPGQSAPGPTPHAEALGWKLGVQAFSFYTITFAEAVEHISSLGLKYIEVMPFGRLSPDYKNVATNHNMSPEQRDIMRGILREAGVSLSSYGVVTITNDEAECRKIFEFAHDMGFKTIVSEPPPEAMDLLERLCEEYQITLAIHNHPTPSAYWDPQTVKKAVENRSPLMGACADVSHWQRSGLDVVDSLQLLEGRIKTFHFGEVDGEKAAEFAAKREGLALDDSKYPSMIMHVRGIPNVVYGTGPADMRSWLQEIHRQGIKAVFSIEAFFDVPAQEAVARMKPSIAYFETIARELNTVKE